MHHGVSRYSIQLWYIGHISRNPETPHCCNKPVSITNSALKKDNISYLWYTVSYTTGLNQPNSTQDSHHPVYVTKQHFGPVQCNFLWLSMLGDLLCSLLYIQPSHSTRFLYCHDYLHCIFSLKASKLGMNTWNYVLLNKKV